MAESGRAAWACWEEWACWDSGAEVATAERPLLGGTTLSYSCGLSFLRKRSFGPPLRLAVAKTGSGGL